MVTIFQVSSLHCVEINDDFVISTLPKPDPVCSAKICCKLGSGKKLKNPMYGKGNQCCLISFLCTSDKEKKRY